MNTRLLLTAGALLLTLSVSAQATDKHDADMLVYNELTAGYQTENWHADLNITKDMLRETHEKDVYIAPGDSFQVKSMRSDFYVTEKEGKYEILNNARYPIETTVNLLLNHIRDNKHQLELRHHQYGGQIPKFVIPMQNVYDFFARNMQLYCSCNLLDNQTIRAVVVFHQKKMDFIHMIELQIPIAKLSDPQSTLSGDLYTNIPQTNIHSLFREKKSNQNKKTK